MYAGRGFVCDRVALPQEERAFGRGYLVPFLAEGNFPVPSIHRLREAGYDVAAVIEDNRGCDDKTVMARAVSERRIIVTFDRDYGELIYLVADFSMT